MAAHAAVVDKQTCHEMRCHNPDQRSRSLILHQAGTFFLIGVATDSGVMTNSLT